MTARASDAFVDVRPLLTPRSVAVVGASDQPGSFGGETVRRLLKFGFPGRVTPISRTATSVAGLPCFKRIADMPEAPELVVLAIPAGALIEAVKECADCGVRYGIAYAGGLAEAGGEGAELQRALVALCREREFVLCGPNCVGVIDATTPVASTFSTALHEMESLRPGTISLVCQSGGIATTAFSMVQEAGFGMRYLVSSGNEAVVDFSDYVHAFAQDPGTSIIGGYLEGIGNGPKFVRALEEARRNGKSVVLIKAGTTGATARAAQAHTGALVGEDRVVDAVLREMGVMRVHSVEEMVDLLLFLAGNAHKTASGPGVGLITFGGGNGVLGADQCAQAGLATPPLSSACVERLQPLLDLGGHGRESTGPHAVDGVQRGGVGATAARTRHRRRGARDPIARLHRGLDGREGRRDFRRRLRVERARERARVRELAIAAACGAGPAGAARHLRVPRGGAGHPRTRQPRRARRCASSAFASGGGFSACVRLARVRAGRRDARGRVRAHVSSHPRGCGIAGRRGTIGRMTRRPRFVRPRRLERRS